MSKINVKNIPYNIYIKNVSTGPISMQMYRKNLKLDLNAGDELIVKSETSDSTMFYMSLANKSIRVIAEPDKILFTVSYSLADSASIEVIRDGKEIDDETDLNMGDQIKITATAESGYEVVGLTVNGEAFTSGQKYTVTENDVVIEIDVETVKLNTLTIGTVENGEIEVHKGETKLATGATVKTGEKLVITINPDEGYVVKTLTVNTEAFVSGSTFTVGITDVVVAGEVEEEPSGE